MLVLPLLPSSTNNNDNLAGVVSSITLFITACWVPQIMATRLSNSNDRSGMPHIIAVLSWMLLLLLLPLVVVIPSSSSSIINNVVSRLFASSSSSLLDSFTAMAMIPLLLSISSGTSSSSSPILLPVVTSSSIDRSRGGLLYRRNVELVFRGTNDGRYDNFLQ